MSTGTPEQFIGEQITPASGTASTAGMARGEPGLPGRFTWRDREYHVLRVLQQWKSSGPCRSGGGEIYLRRHWYKVMTEPPAIMTIYFDRQARQPRRPRARWWLYSLQPCTPSPSPGIMPPAPSDGGAG